MSAADRLDDLERERAVLVAPPALRRFHRVVVVLSLLMTIAGWQLALRGTHAKAHQRFEHEAIVTTDALAWRLGRRLDALAAALDVGSSRTLAGVPAGPDPSADVLAETVTDVMQGILSPERRLVGLSLMRDGATLYADARTPGDPEPANTLERTLSLGGGTTWRASVWSTPALERRARRYLPWAVLVGGLVAEALLLALFVAQARSARRTLVLAEETAGLSLRLRAKAAELERANGELESFACVASHDLKAPLTGATLLLRSVLDDLEDTEADSGDAASLLPRLQRLDARLVRMQGLIDGILAWGEVGARAVAAEPVDVASLVRRIGRDLHARDGQVRISPGLPVLHTDALRLEQVFANLVGNAFKYHPTPENATVHVHAERTDDRVRFLVDDDGPGIPEAHRARVFAMFDTGAQGGARPDATGLGLAIVEKSVALVGGTASVTDSPMGGARFSFTWPASADELEWLGRAVDGVDGAVLLRAA